MTPAARILIVDDDKLARWALREKLAQHGHPGVAEAGSAEELLTLVGAQTFDLIMLDIGLPGISGLEALAKLKELGCTATVIMVTAHDEPDIIVQALRNGAADYLCKPFELDSIASVIERHLPASAAPDGLPPDASWSQFIGHSPAIDALRLQVQRLCRSSAQTILIQGPSGCGKSLLARAIHDGGSRAHAPFMEINCAALPAHLLESELFGHERGAFTDAKQAKPGLFELADGGILLLDEIGDMNIVLQAKLLRVIEDRRFKRVGGVTDIAVDVCVIATTNVDLEVAVSEGRFRLDLFYRLNVVPLAVPPLHRHPEDIPLLVEGLISRLNTQLHTNVRGISRSALSLLCRYAWPGNVRELRNVLERIMLLSNEATILVDHLPPEIVKEAISPTTDEAAAAVPAANLATPVAALLQQCARLDDIEREVIRQGLAAAHGNLSEAGKRLGLHRDTLRYRARKYGVLD